jgi:hypothetical protein
MKKKAKKTVKTYSLVCEIEFPEDCDCGFWFIGPAAETDHHPATAGDYSPFIDEEVIMAKRAAILNGYAQACRAALALDMEIPVVYLADLSTVQAPQSFLSIECCAMYLDGSYRVLLLDPAVHQEDGEIGISLLHELAHLYLDTCGLGGGFHHDYEDAPLDVEDVAEGFAREFGVDPVGAVSTLIQQAMELSDFLADQIYTVDRSGESAIDKTCAREVPAPQ